jgi:hypothetical protein
VLIILHEVPKAGVPEHTARLFWRKPDATWKSTGSSAATIGALRGLLEDYQAAVDRLEERASGAKRAAEWFSLIHEATPVHRAALGLAAALQEARDATKTDQQVISVRDWGQDIERAVELITAHARSGLDFSIAQAGEESAAQHKHVAQAQHRLNLIAATFLPISALGVLFSMQLPNGLEKWNAPWLFWGIAGMAFLVGLLVRASLPKAEKP